MQTAPRPQPTTSRLTKKNDDVPSTRFVTELVQVTEIYSAKTNVVTLRRTPSSDLREDAQRAAASPGFQRISEIGTESTSRDLEHKLGGFPHLALDARFWSQVLVDITGCQSVGLRLAAMESPMCPRFHVDLVTLRLVVTYQGPGTEFVSNNRVDRTHLGHSTSRGSAGSSAPAVTPEDIQSANSFDIVLLKGEAWPENKGFGAVHRSPPMMDSAPRLVMTLDPL